MYIHQTKCWPHFTFDQSVLNTLLSHLRLKQGRLLGYAASIGFEIQDDAILKTITMDVLKSSEIEGILIHPEQVRSSIARKLGLDIGGLIPSDRNVDGMVEMLLDGTQHYEEKLTKERLLKWHTMLFPTEYSGSYKILVGTWRDDSTGPMQVVSGAMGKEKVHFQAPDAPLLENEMLSFLDWFNGEERTDAIIKAGIAHLWFVTIHPFDDGNGRIARALTDMLLARSEGSPQRFYSMSAQIREQRKQYYDLLEETQWGNMDITKWLLWFINCMDKAIDASNETLKDTFAKAKFWQNNLSAIVNERQKFMINKLLDDFYGSLTSSKWAKMTKSSSDTALRDIQDLISKGILEKDPETGGRSTNYLIKL